MRKQGKIVRWEAERGFGFIRSDHAGDAQEAFVHIRELRHGTQPEVGLRVEYDEIHIGGRGPRAVAVVARDQAHQSFGPARSSPRATHRSARQESNPQRASGSMSMIGLPLIVLYAATLIWASVNGRLPAVAPLLATLLNAVTFFVYWLDKYASLHRQWRTSESTLHAFALAGGWPGAWLAQLLLRHKCTKASFREVFWATVLVHCAVLAAFLWVGTDTRALTNRAVVQTATQLSGHAV